MYCNLVIQVVQSAVTLEEQSISQHKIVLELRGVVAQHHSTLRSWQVAKESRVACGARSVDCFFAAWGMRSVGVCSAYPSSV